MRTARSLTIGGGGGCLPRGVSAQGGVCLGGTSCIWCYLYGASTPTECQHQCSCLYGVTQVRAGMRPPVDGMTDGCKNITLPQTSFAGGKYCMHLIKT